jgi:hypothetical protein
VAAAIAVGVFASACGSSTSGDGGGSHASDPGVGFAAATIPLTSGATELTGADICNRVAASIVEASEVDTSVTTTDGHTCRWDTDEAYVQASFFPGEAVAARSQDARNDRTVVEGFGDGASQCDSTFNVYVGDDLVQVHSCQHPPAAALRSIAFEVLWLLDIHVDPGSITETAVTGP